MFKGALDNTADATIAMAEHMVLKEITNEIYIFRLPVGHTHEDIDSRYIARQFIYYYIYYYEYLLLF